MEKPTQERIQQLKLQQQKWKEERAADEPNRIQREKDRWTNLKEFETPNDVPTLPVVDSVLWKEFYIPTIISKGGIPKIHLFDGQVYIGSTRNGKIGKWNAKENCFEYWRYKFGWIIDKCNHFEDDNGFALFVPIKLGTEEEFNNIPNTK